MKFNFKRLSKPSRTNLIFSAPDKISFRQVGASDMHHNSRVTEKRKNESFTVPNKKKITARKIPFFGDFLLCLTFKVLGGPLL